jgi:hypothetical protein
MGIDPMNKISIIIRILFAVTLFQHKELTCPVFREICGEEGFSQLENEQVNMCGQKYNVGMNDWMKLKSMVGM